MAQASVLSDEELKDYLSKGVPQSQIAKLYRISQPAVNKRVKAMERKAAPKQLHAVTRVQENMWRTEEAATRNYQRCLDELENADEVQDRIRLITELRKHIEFSVRYAETLFVVNEVKAWQEELKGLLADTEPALRDKFLDRLQQRQSLQASVGGSATTVSTRTGH